MPCVLGHEHKLLSLSKVNAMDYSATDFDKWGQLLIARGNFKGLFFRKSPYIIIIKK